MICAHCDQEMVELSRNQHHVFYKCGCNRYMMVDYDWKTALVDGEELILGAAGSFVLKCPECGRCTYRSRISNEVCLFCRKARVVPLRMED